MNVSKISRLGCFMMIMTCVGLYLQACGAAYQGPASDHFDGSRFYNSEPDEHSFGKMVKWLWEMDRVAWPKWVDDPRQPTPVERVGQGTLRVTYINHATILIQMDDLNILTDPIWSFRAGPVSWLGSKRVRAPGVALEQLPRIDYLLISHDHYDHLDLSSLRQIAERDQPTILVGLGVKKLLSAKGIPNVEEMDWWQTLTPDNTDVTFTFVPARHTSGRGPFSGQRTLWGGFMIASPHGNVYFAGDTAYGAFLNEIHERFGRIRLAIFPIGNYEKRWFMQWQHMNPDDAVQAHQLLGVSQSIGMHFGTFLEHPEQTIDEHESDLADALKTHRVLPSQFWILQFGEGRDVPEISDVDHGKFDTSDAS